MICTPENERFQQNGTCCVILTLISSSAAKNLSDTPKSVKEATSLLSSVIKYFTHYVQSLKQFQSC